MRIRKNKITNVYHQIYINNFYDGNLRKKRVNTLCYMYTLGKKSKHPVLTLQQIIAEESY